MSLEVIKKAEYVSCCKDFTFGERKWVCLCKCAGDATLMSRKTVFKMSLILKTDLRDIRVSTVEVGLGVERSKIEVILSIAVLQNNSNR